MTKINFATEEMAKAYALRLSLSGITEAGSIDNLTNNKFHFVDKTVYIFIA